MYTLQDLFVSAIKDVQMWRGVALTSWMQGNRQQQEIFYRIWTGGSSTSWAPEYTVSLAKDLLALMIHCFVKALCTKSTVLRAPTDTSGPVLAIVGNGDSFEMEIASVCHCVQQDGPVLNTAARWRGGGWTLRACSPGVAFGESKNTVCQYQLNLPSPVPWAVDRAYACKLYPGQFRG